MVFTTLSWRSSNQFAASLARKGGVRKSVRLEDGVIMVMVEQNLDRLLKQEVCRLSWAVSLKLSWGVFDIKIVDYNVDPELLGESLDLRFT